jgi:hypothetical protein
MSKINQKLHTEYRGSSRDFPQDAVLQAIKGSGSIISTIAKRLNCDWITAKRYVNKWEITRKAYEAEEETVLDMAESKLYEGIQQGNTQDAKWLLSTKGKKRGFTERHEVTGPDGGAIIIKYDKSFDGI